MDAPEARIRIIECIVNHAALASFGDPDKLITTAKKVEAYVMGTDQPKPRSRKPKQPQEQG